MTPQWDFLNVLAAAGEAEPTFSLRMGTECLELLRSGGRVVGVRCRGRDGEEELRADLVIGCDGRTSGVLPAPVMGKEALQGRPITFTTWNGYGSNIAQLAKAVDEELQRRHPLARAKDREQMPDK